MPTTKKGAVKKSLNTNPVSHPTRQKTSPTSTTANTKSKLPISSNSLSPSPLLASSPHPDNFGITFAAPEWALKFQAKFRNSDARFHSYETRLGRMEALAENIRLRADLSATQAALTKAQDRISTLLSSQGISANSPPPTRRRKAHVENV